MLAFAKSLCVFAQEPRVSDFNWNDLRAFLAVARTGRLTAASARVGADHTTVSRRDAPRHRRVIRPDPRRGRRQPSRPRHGEKGPQVVPVEIRHGGSCAKTHNDLAKSILGITY